MVHSLNSENLYEDIYYDDNHTFGNETVFERNYGTVTTFVRASSVLLLRVGLVFIQVGCIPNTNVNLLLLHNVMDIMLSTTAYGIFGYVLSYGLDVAGFIGTESWLVFDNSDLDNAVLGWTAVIISTGVFTTMVAGRIHLIGHITVITLFTGVLLPILMHWTWAQDGWMYKNHMLDSDVSFKDQGGGCVVHASGGILALFGALFLGRRILFLKELDESSLPPSSPCCTLMGYALIMLGLTAFSLPTPRYELTRWPDNYIGVIVMNIVMSSSGGAITVVLLQLLVVRDSFTYWPMLRCVQGALAGIVVILPGVDVYRPLVSLAIGLSVGIILFIGARQTYQSAIEDYANVITVHLVCGFLGVLLPPLLGSAENLGTRFSHHVMAHLGWQMICGSVLVLVVAAIMFPVFVILTWLGFLRNKEDARHHRRALVLQKQLSKRVFFRRLLKLDNSHDVLIPGYESKSNHPQFLDAI